MIKYFLLFLSIVCLSISNIEAQELRTEFSFKKNLAPKLEGNIKVLFRDIQDNHVLIDKVAIQGRISLKPASYIKIGSTVRYTTKFKNSKEELKIDDRIRVTGDLSLKSKRLSDITLSNRSRIQYSFNPENETEVRYRNRLKLDYRLSKRVHPYVAFEPFYSFQERKIENYRLYGGSKFKIHRSRLELFIILELLHDETYFTNRIFGLSYQF